MTNQFNKIEYQEKRADCYDYLYNISYKLNYSI